MQTNELISLAQQIREWQTQRGLSDSELCRKFTGLGSTKTFNRILEGDVEELDLERWAMQYGQVWNLILELRSRDQNEPIYDDLFHITAFRLAAKAAMEEKGNNRLVIIEGPSGSGKTTAARCLAARYGRKIVLSEADETWRTSLNAMLGGLLRALGVQEIPTSADERKTKLLATLGDTCLIIDEAHHLGLPALNMVKTLLNQTGVKIVFLCIPTLFRRLESLAYEEARQLTKNRLAERVRLGAPSAKDVESFLSRRLKWVPGAMEPCAAKLADLAAAHGFWNFVNLVARAAMAEAKNGPLSEELFASAVQKAQSSR